METSSDEMPSKDSVSTCVPFPDKPENCTILAEISRWVSVLSLIGSLFVIILIYGLKKHKQCLPQRLILALSFGSLIFSVSGILSDSAVQRRSTQCIVQGFFIQFGIWAILAWVACISFNVCWNVLLLRSTSRRQEILYHIGSWGISLLMSCIPFAIGRNAYGPTGGWCWITSDYKIFRFIGFYIPLYTFLVVVVIVYVFIALKFYRRTKRWQGSYNPEQERIDKQSRDAARSLLLYPIVYVLLSIFPLINRVYQALDGEGKAQLSLVILHAITAPMMGLANAIVYAWDKETSVRVRNALHNYRGRLRYRKLPKPQIQDYHVQRPPCRSMLSPYEHDLDDNQEDAPYHAFQPVEKISELSN